MQFIGQVVPYPELFGAVQAEMAYIFMSVDAAPSGLLPSTSRPDKGENAVVLQPGSGYEPSAPLIEGPSLYRFVGPERVPCEFAVDLHPANDPDDYQMDQAWLEDTIEAELAWGAYMDRFYEDKIGGTPVPRFGAKAPRPGPGTWKLLLQLAENDDRCILNFGTDGVGYAFISEDGRIGKFLWQRP